MLGFEKQPGSENYLVTPAGMVAHCVLVLLILAMVWVLRSELYELLPFGTETMCSLHDYGGRNRFHAQASDSLIGSRPGVGVIHGMNDNVGMESAVFNARGAPTQAPAAENRLLASHKAGTAWSAVSDMHRSDAGGAVSEASLHSALNSM